MRPFNASNKPDTCPWCGRAITGARRGGYGPFDTKDCAEAFARAAYTNGYRFAPPPIPAPAPGPLVDTRRSGGAQ